ncbi:MAG: hypothetical protein ABR964_04930 [Tepidisphaeraceae bacterium]|jgi:hypothetical protein
MNARLKTLALFFAAMAGGCAGASSPIQTARPVTDKPVEQATADYWLNQPANVAVSSLDFQRLWDASAQVLRQDLFIIDRVNDRQGVMVTRPMVSKQIFEPWRSDAGTMSATLQSTLQTIRRTVRIDVQRSDGGLFTARIKVLVERLSLIQQRVTSVAESHNVFSAIGPETTFQTTEGTPIPVRYWYAIGRDQAMERQLANAIEDQLKDRRQ